jgi:hypothetical protein
MAKTISQKKFARGINAATGILSQQPGCLTRMSNLLLTQRGSLQVCDGSEYFANWTSTYPNSLWIDAYSNYAVGQYPYYSMLAQRAAALFSAPTGFTAVPSGTTTNPAGTYFFGVVAIGSAGGLDHTGLTVPGSAVQMTAASSFASVVFNWTAVAGVYGYQVYYLNVLPTGGSNPLGVLLGTVVGSGTTTFTFTGTLTAPTAAAPIANTTRYVQLLDFYQVANQSITDLFPVSVTGGLFPGVAPQQVNLLPGDPQFNPVSSAPGFSPYGGIVGAVCSIPIELQFAALEVLILGNGITPLTYDPSKLGTVAPVSIVNSFTAAYPTWQASVSWITGAQLQAMGYVFTAIQGGVSGSGSTPFTAGSYTIGQLVADGSVMWKATVVIAALPAPRGAAHAVVYAGSLWLANTAPQTSADQLDGPTVLKMSDANNPNSWNPVNIAFIGRDDGSQITGMQPFTIAALGISPTGSMAVFKEFQTYQIIGVFGSNNFEIQAAQTDMGCLAARSIQFIPGFGIVRYSHLGFAVYDGVNDRVISEEIRPYLFGGIEIDSDIVKVDPAYLYLSKSAQAVQPPMYMCAMPLVGGAGVLTRVFCYDLILKSWIIIDLPWPITSLNRVKGGEGNPMVIAGVPVSSALGPSIHRLQSGDGAWSINPANPTVGSTVINWGFRSPDVFGEGSSQRIFYREMVLRGYGTPGQAATVVATPVLDGARQQSMVADIVPQDVKSKQFELRFKLWLNGQVCHIDFSGSGQMVIDSIDWDIEPKSANARRVIG